MVELENGIVIPLKQKSYRRYVDMFNKRTFNANVIVFERMSNNYHPKKQLNIALNPKKLLQSSLMLTETNRTFNRN